VGLVAVALGTVMLPHLSRMAAAGQEEQMKATLDWGLNLGCMLGLPAAVALYLLAEPLVATLFMSLPGGAMTDHDARMAGHALEMFAVALPGFVLVRVLAPAFFAREDTRSPFRYASGAVAANLIVSLATFSWFGHVGLAWATAVSAWTHVFLLMAGLHRRNLYAVTRAVWPLLSKTLVATAALTLAIVLLAKDWPWLDMPALQRLFWMTVVCVGGLAIYLIVLGALGVRPRHLMHSSVTNSQTPTQAK
jgi:putative peptidoglycan lipid II flippase